MRHESFLLTDDPDYAGLNDALTMRDTAGVDRDWMVIDLQALRARKWADMSTQWRRAVGQYDLLVVAPELTPHSDWCQIACKLVETIYIPSSVQPLPAYLFMNGAAIMAVIK